MRVKAHKNGDFVLGDGCRELSSAATSPAGCIWQQYARQQIAATYHATCRRAYYREQAARLPAAAHAAEALPQKTTVVCYRRGTTAVHAAGILPRDGSSAQRAGDSDVGANDKGAGDDPGDGVDAH